MAWNHFLKQIIALKPEYELSLCITPTENVGFLISDLQQKND